MNRVTGKLLFISNISDSQDQPVIFTGWSCFFWISLPFLAR